MNIQFATCERSTALRYLQSVYPNKSVADTPECAGPLLDLVEKDYVRVQDPMMYGSRIGLVAGKRYQEADPSEVQSTCSDFAARVSALPEANQ